MQRHTIPFNCDCGIVNIYIDMDSFFIVIWVINGYLGYTDSFLIHVQK